MTEQDELVARFRGAQQELVDAVAGIDEARSQEIWCGDWGVKQIIAHIAGWQEAMAGALENLARGERPSPVGVDSSDVDGTNANLSAQAVNETLPAVLASLQASGTHLESAVLAMPDERIAEGRTGRRIVETMIGHPGEHAGEIRSWRQARGI